MLSLNVDLVRGYSGAAPIFLAMLNGELDGQMIGVLSSVKSSQRDLWNDQGGPPAGPPGSAAPPALPELADVPTGRELTGDPGALALIEFAELPFFMALPFNDAAGRAARARQGVADGIHANQQRRDVC